MALYYTCSFVTVLLLSSVVSEEEMAGHGCDHFHTTGEQGRKGHGFYQARDSKDQKPETVVTSYQDFYKPHNSEGQKARTAVSYEPNTYGFIEFYQPRNFKEQRAKTVVSYQPDTNFKESSAPSSTANNFDNINGNLYNKEKYYIDGQLHPLAPSSIAYNTENNANTINPYNFDQETFNADGKVQIVHPIVTILRINPTLLECSSDNSRRNHDNVPKSQAMKDYDMTHDSKDEKSADRILGGAETTIQDVPYQVSVQLYSRHFCGGSIITSTHVVTAAHCTIYYQVSAFRIRAGSTYSDRGGVLIDVAQKFDNKYDKNTKNWDVSVLKLAKSLNFNNYIQPIRLPEEFQTWDVGTPGIVSGWGVTREGASRDTQPTHLMTTVLHLEDRNYCERSLNKTITDTMFCTNGGSTNRDTCQGDSGGAIVVEGILAGIVSWGRGCGRREFPGVNTNVPMVVRYIKDVAML